MKKSYKLFKSRIKNFRLPSKTAFAASAIVGLSIGNSSTIPTSTATHTNSGGSQHASNTTGSESVIKYQSPITITKGGTYSGNWESLNPNVAAVTVKTSEPVIIENSKLRGRGVLIDASNGFRSNITVRNTYGFGLNPNVSGRAIGRFFRIWPPGLPGKIVIENCYMQNTAGITIVNDGSTSNAISVKIRYNKAYNIDGRKSNGNNGFLKDFERVQFVGLDSLQKVSGIEIAWNEVINDPYKSRVEDNINIYKSSGTSSSPLLIHDNYIKGGYPANPAQNTEYTGGGILLGDSGSGGSTLATGFVKAYNNQVINTANYGIAIAAGHDLQFYNNRMISSGQLPDGTRPPAAKNSVGGYVWDFYGEKSSGKFYNNFAYGNTIGWYNTSTRNDTWFPNCETGKCTNNTSLPDPISLNTETAEYQTWQNKVTNAKIALGPVKEVLNAQYYDNNDLTHLRLTRTDSEVDLVVSQE